MNASRIGLCVGREKRTPLGTPAPMRSGATLMYVLLLEDEVEYDGVIDIVMPFPEEPAIGLDSVAEGAVPDEGAGRVPAKLVAVLMGGPMAVFAKLTAEIGVVVTIELVIVKPPVLLEFGASDSDTIL